MNILKNVIPKLLLFCPNCESNFDVIYTEGNKFYCMRCDNSFTINDCQKTYRLETELEMV